MSSVRRLVVLCFIMSNQISLIQASRPAATTQAERARQKKSVEEDERKYDKKLSYRKDTVRLLHDIEIRVLH